MKKLIIDRIEGTFALCEIKEGSFAEIPLAALPDGLKEGDVISISIDENETLNRKKRIEGLMNSLFKD